MAVAIRVEAAVPGRARAGTAEHDVALPLEDGTEVALRELIGVVVRAEVAAFQARAEERSFLRVLTQRDIDEGMARGVVQSGDADATREVDVEAAVETALLAFDDGLYSVVIAEEPVDRLDDRVLVTSDLRMLFLRLVPLAGG